MSDLDDDILVLYRQATKELTAITADRDKIQNDLLMADTYWSGAISQLNNLLRNIKGDPIAVRALEPYKLQLDALSSTIALYLKVSEALRPRGKS